MPLDLIRRRWFAPAAVLALGVVAVAGNAIAAFGETGCQACREGLVIAAVGLPIVLASLLAAIVGAAEMITRRSLLLAGLIFGMSIYLNVGRARAAWFSGTECVGAECAGSFWIGWNVALSAVMLAVAVWGAFAKAPPAPASP